MIEHVQDHTILQRMATGIVERTLVNESEMRLIMPPFLALSVPMQRLTSTRILDLIAQPRRCAVPTIHHLPPAHRFVTVHHCINYYWVRSFLGHLVLLVRSPDFEPMVAVHRLQQGVHHNSVIWGTMILHAIDDAMYEPEQLNTHARIQVQVVVILLAIMNGSPVGCVAEALRWVARHPLGIQMARNKCMRPVMRAAISASRPALCCIPLLGDSVVMRFMVRVSRHIPTVVDCLLEEDGQTWTSEAIQVLCKEGTANTVDVLVWQFLFTSSVPRAVLDGVLQERRFVSRDWYAPLRMHWGLRDSHMAPRGAAPLLRMVSADPPAAEDTNRAMEQLMFPDSPDVSPTANRWWKAAHRNTIPAAGKGLLAVRAWLLQRIRTYMEIVYLGRLGMQGLMPLVARNEQRLLLILNGNPCTAMVGECLWFLLHCGSDIGLTCSVMQWISQHRFSWVSVLRDATTNGALGAVLPTLLERCTVSPDLTQKLAPLMLVIWSTMPGPSEGWTMLEPHLATTLESMSCFQQEAFLALAVESQQYTMWASAVLSRGPTLNRWVENIFEMEGFGTLSDIVRYYERPETDNVPQCALDAIVSSLVCVTRFSAARLEEFDEFSDLRNFFGHLLGLFRKEYHFFTGL
jgi:hypothetical protein